MSMAKKKREWILVEERLPANGQYVWLTYHPWNNPANDLVVQAAVYRDGLWVTHNPPGTSFPPVHWMPNPSQPPPDPPEKP